MKRLYVYNFSTTVSADQLGKMIRAINSYLVTLCGEWNIASLSLTAATYNPRAALVPCIFIFDNTDDDSALGYHYEVAGVPVGRVFAKTILNYGGAVLYKNPTTLTVAQCLAHEALEMLGNGQINKWYTDSNDDFWAAELCDPVQDRLLTVTIDKTVKVGLSDYVLPAWFSPNTTQGPFNKLNTLRAPFTIDDYGYAIKIVNGELVAVYGSKATPKTREEALEKIEKCRFGKSK